MMDPMIASHQSLIGFLRADLGIEFVLSQEGSTQKAKISPAQTVTMRKRTHCFPFGQVPDEGDIREKKSDIENPKEGDSDTG